MTDKSDKVQPKKIDQKEEDLFKMPTNIELIHDLPEELKEPGYVYRSVIVTYPYDPFRKQKLEALGWEVVCVEGNEIDDRGSAPKSKPNVRKAPLTVQRQSGHTAIWMRIKEDVFNKRQKAKVEENERKLHHAVKVSNTPSGKRITGKTTEIK